MTARLLPVVAATAATVAVARMRRPVSVWDVLLLVMVPALLARGIAATRPGVDLDGADREPVPERGCTACACTDLDSVQTIALCPCQCHGGRG